MSAEAALLWLLTRLTEGMLRVTRVGIFFVSSSVSSQSLL